MSDAVGVMVGNRMGTPPKLSYNGVTRVAEIEFEVNATAGDGSLSLKDFYAGYGYAQPPKVVIDNFGTGGFGLELKVDEDFIDPITGEILDINITSLGSGYLTPPRIRLEEGFPTIEASGIPGSAEASGFTPATSPDDQGNPRNPPGLASIRVLNPGSGYLQPPEVLISHPTAEGAEAVATLQPAANGRGEEIANINVTLPGGGRPIEFDANGTNPTRWLPGYDGRTSVTLVGGIPFDEAPSNLLNPNLPTQIVPCLR